MTRVYSYRRRYFSPRRERERERERALSGIYLNMQMGCVAGRARQGASAVGYMYPKFIIFLTVDNKSFANWRFLLAKKY